MPLFGTRDIDPLLAAAPRMEDTDADAWETEGVETLQLMFEINDSNVLALLPPALHPTIPAVATWSVARYPDSPFGAFTLAQVRVGGRAGTRPRGFLLRAYCDSPRACEALASGWGFAVRKGEVRLQRYHDRIAASVSANGADVLRMALVNPEPISGGDVQYTANMHLVRLTGADGERGALVQVDPEFRFHRAERGRPLIEAFDCAAWAAEGVEPVYPVHASFTVCATGLPRIRYVLDPLKPAVTGERRPAAGRPAVR